MSLEIKELPFSEAGKGYEFDDEGRNHTVLVTKANAYRGNHTHPYNQYTLLLRGKARYLLHGGREENTGSRKARSSSQRRENPIFYFQRRIH